MAASSSMCAVYGVASAIHDDWLASISKYWLKTKLGVANENNHGEKAVWRMAHPAAQ